MEKLFVEGDVVANLPGVEGNSSSIAKCTTLEQFKQWCSGVGPEHDLMACNYGSQVYVKIPQSLDENGEFSLNYDCIPLEEANNRIERWNIHHAT